MRHYDSAGFLSTMKVYQCAESQTPPRTSLLSQTDSYISGRDGSFLHTYTTYPLYDAYGNLTRTVSYGDSSQSGDELQTDTTYVPNTDTSTTPHKYIVGLPGKVERRVPGGPALQTETFEYDNNAWTVAPAIGNLTAAGRKLDPGGATVKRGMTYNGYGQVLTSTDETSRPIITTYETVTGHSLFPATVRNAANDTTTFASDASCAAITSTILPSGQATTKATNQTYDNLCRPSRTTPPVIGAYTQLNYLDLGNVALQRTRTETNGPDTLTDWSEDYFDGLGRTYKSLKRGPTAAQTIVAEKTFNARGGVATSTEPYYANAAPQSLRVTSYEYDTSDRLVRTELPDGNDIETEYMANGQKTTDPNGKTVTTRVDGLTKEVERLWNGSPSITTTTYDILGRQIALLDAKGHTWTYGYDSLNRQREENDPDAGDWFYEYDAAGRPLQQTDAKGQVTSMTYDPAGRIATKTSPVGTVTYTYSQARPGYFNTGQLTTVDSLFDDLLLDYDILGRTPKLQRVINGITYTVTKSWDAGGYLIGTKYPDDYEVGNAGAPLGYDEAGRLKSIPNFVSNITYDAAGRPLQKTNAGGNNAVTNWTYHPQRGFLTGLGTTSSAGTLQNLTYGYDAAGLVQNSTQQLANTSGGLTTQSWTYGYDSFDHLTTATDANTPANSQTWIYDEIGRIKTNTSTSVLTYTYPLDGSATRPHAPETVNGANRTYDANGHLTAASGQALTWDGENRLSQAVVSGTTTNFAYDSVGERIAKASGTNVSIYPFGDDYEIRNGTVTKYISVEGLGVVAKRVGTTNYWLHTDRLGSIQVVTSSSGSPQLGRTYRPYGETLTTAGSHTEFRGWIDQRNDSESGFTYLHARYFDPKLGLFLSPDRLHPMRKGVGLNRFGYGFGDPVSNSDRSGNQCWRNVTSWKEGRGYEFGDELFCIEQVVVDGGGGYRTWMQPYRDRNDRRSDRKDHDKKDDSNEEEQPPTKPECAARELVPEKVGYADLNITGGHYGAVATVGGQFTQNAVFPYGGLGIGTPGISASLTGAVESRSNPGPVTPSPGLNIALTITVPPIVTLQLGYGAVGRKGSWFLESGAGGPPGVSLTGYWTSEPIAMDAALAANVAVAVVPGAQVLTAFVPQVNFLEVCKE